MNADINLLPRRKGSIFRSERMLAQVRVAAMLSVVLVVIAGIGVVFLNQTNSPSALKKQEDLLSATISASKTKAIAQLELVDRLNHIQTILAKRSTLEKNILLVQSEIPPSVTINSFSLEDKTLMLSVSADDLSLIDTVIAHMTALLQTKKFIKKMTIENVVADQKTGKYVLSLDASL